MKLWKWYMDYVKRVYNFSTNLCMRIMFGMFILITLPLVVVALVVTVVLAFFYAMFRSAFNRGVARGEL